MTDLPVRMGGKGVLRNRGDPSNEEDDFEMIALNRLWAVFSSRPFPNIPKYKDHQWDLPTIWKAKLLQTRYILKSSTSTYESSHQQLFWTTGIQSRPDVFDESKFVMTFLTIFRVTEILCSFRWVLEGKTGNEIPESSRLEFSEKFLANSFALSDARQQLWAVE